MDYGLRLWFLQKKYHRNSEQSDAENDLRFFQNSISIQDFRRVFIDLGRRAFDQVLADPVKYPAFFIRGIRRWGSGRTSGRRRLRPALW